MQTKEALALARQRYVSQDPSTKLCECGRKAHRFHWGFVCKFCDDYESNNEHRACAINTGGGIHSTHYTEFDFRGKLSLNQNIY